MMSPQTDLDAVFNAYLQLADILDSYKRTANAQEVLELAVRHFPDSALLQLGLGRWYLTRAASDEQSLFLLDEAIRIMRRVLTITSTASEIQAVAYEILGLALRLDEDYPAAVAALKEAQRLNRNGLFLWIALGDCLSRIGSRTMLDDALVALDKALQLDPNSVDALRFKGRVLREMNQASLALTIYNQAFALDNSNAFVLTGRAECYRILNDLNAALHDLNQAIAVMPNYSLAWVRRSAIKIAQEDYDGALEDLSHVLQIDPNLPGALANRGLVYQYLQNYEHSLLDLTTAVEQQAQPLDVVYTYRGQTLRFLNRLDDAIKDFDAALVINADSIPALSGRAYCRYRLSDYQLALDDFNTVLLREPNNLWALQRRADILFRLDRNTECIEDLDRADRLAPGDPLNGALRSRVLLDRDDAEGALLSVEAGSDDPNASPLAKIVLGEVLTRLRRYSEALDAFHDALKRRTREDSDWILYDIGILYKKTMRSKEAATHLHDASLIAQEKLTVTAEKYTTPFNLALYHLANDDNDKAQDLYQQLIADGPSQWYLVEARRDIASFLHIFPEHPCARHIIETLSSALAAHDSAKKEIPSPVEVHQANLSG